MVSDAPIAIATQPIPTLTVFHQCAVQLPVRIASLDIILLDFDAITGQFLSFSERPRSGCGHGLDGLVSRTVLTAANG
jgi:hypothetical protein